MMNCGHESGDQENLAATSLATRWLAAILQDGCAWQEDLKEVKKNLLLKAKGQSASSTTKSKAKTSTKPSSSSSLWLREERLKEMISSLARNPLIKLPVLVAAVLVEKMSSPVVEHHLLLVEERVHLHQVSRKNVQEKNPAPT